MKPLRTFFCLSLFALALPGCSILGSEQRDPVTIYSPDVRVAPEADWPSVPWTLVIAKPTASRVVDSPRITVRPVPGELQVYRGVSWAQPATDLLQDAVQRTLEDSGRIGAVASADAGILGDYKLVMDLRRFEADYAGETIPSAVVEVNAKLVHNRDQYVVASRTFLHRQSAGGVEIGQVAGAFEQALSASTREIVGWVLKTGHADTGRKH
ncbi:ABC-type transport auxiliary lipoprotein family protein [Pseudoxanthomonas putridarboris]|uniref:ABC-type transport auxiliary lipoprotein family protein n=1 Tax=Pseudoxanthomonas putridarboris TaxID=752605 RepID=A0ABU9J4J0_9GAMM